MDEITRQKVLKILEGIPVDRQIRIVKAVKVMARMRSGQIKGPCVPGDYQPK
ncbi:MAG TPA: hypothetical protein VJ550_06165 [Geomonas sp.]|nr:hypothetical protein [Geomonas sp.]